MSQTIRPGLERISLLVKDVHYKWRAIHVAGTNGKGSVCAYLQAMLARANIRHGAFTSPHLIYRWDCIRIDNAPVSQSVFLRAEEVVRRRDAEAKIGASPFELLTATAFEIFNEQNVDIGVVECGMGGRLDATNVLKDKLATVITNIGHDHEGFLGNTLTSIANHKAGIMQRGVPCVADCTNPPQACAELEKCAAEAGTRVRWSGQEAMRTSIWKKAAKVLNLDRGDEQHLSVPLHQRRNMLLAYEAMRLGKVGDLPEDRLQAIAGAMAGVQVPGRLQPVNLQKLTGLDIEATLDGAHNEGSWQVLGAHADLLRRAHRRPITWVLAASQGKDIKQMLGLLVKPADRVLAVEFAPVDGMPWIKPVKATEILSAWRESLTPEASSAPSSAPSSEHGSDVIGALRSAVEDKLFDQTPPSYKLRRAPIVIAGSLYLVSTMLRLYEEAEATT